jgi:hypothetical protein
MPYRRLKCNKPILHLSLYKEYFGIGKGYNFLSLPFWDELLKLKTEATKRGNNPFVG